MAFNEEDERQLKEDLAQILAMGDEGNDTALLAIIAAAVINMQVVLRFIVEQQQLSWDE